MEKKSYISDKISFQKNKILEYLVKFQGNVSLACKKCNISRDTHYRWLKEDKKYNKKYNDLLSKHFISYEQKLNQKKISKKTYLQCYKDMLIWRKVEEKASALYIQQKIRGFLHLYNGQEAVLAGCCQAIDISKDKMITAYRNHVHPIAMGVEVKYIIAELMGKIDGCSKGNGGSMHMFSKKHNFFGGHGIVGGQIPLGAGIAFADKYKNKNNVTLCFMGDGAIRQGTFHETLNLAMLWNLPVIFIIENNGYAMGTSVNRSSNHTELWKLGSGYKMNSKYVDGMNFENVYYAMSELVERCKNNEGPSLIEIKTYRYKGHSMSDAQTYRSKEEINDYIKIDPITQILNSIYEKKLASEKEIEKINNEVKKIIDDAVKFAEDSSFPKKEDLYKNVYKQSDYPFIKN